MVNKPLLPPGPRGKFPFGELFEFRRNIIKFMTKIANKYGDVVHFKVGPIRIVLLNHPDLIKEVLSTQHRNFVKGRPLELSKMLLGEGLLTSEGEFHARQSRMIQPAFHHKKIESYGAVMTDYASRLGKSWEEGKKVEMKEAMTNMTTAIAGKTMFNVDIEQEAPEIDQALNAAASLFGRVSIPFSEWLFKLPLPSTFQFYRAKARLDTTIHRMIDERRRNNKDNGDLLSLLLASQDGEGEGERMTDQQIRDEAITLFLTAFDTTSTALTWTWYLLSQNPNAEAELHEELDRVLQGRIPTFADLPQLRYTRMVLAESMRLYPPTYVIPRQALQDFSIDKYIVPGGTLILMSPYLIHHDSRFHPDPETFNPRSWAPHSQGQTPKYAYFPFGGGPRSCIGEPFAWMEGVLVIATLAQIWSMRLVVGHRVEFLPLINLKPRYGMMMTLHRRP